MKTKFAYASAKYSMIRESALAPSPLKQILKWCETKGEAGSFIRLMREHIIQWNNRNATIEISFRPDNQKTSVIIETDAVVDSARPFRKVTTREYLWVDEAKDWRLSTEFEAYYTKTWFGSFTKPIDKEKGKKLQGQYWDDQQPLEF